MFIIIIAFSIFGIACSVILYILITSYAKAAKHRNLTSRLNNAEIFLSDGLCDDALKTLTEIMHQLDSTAVDPLFTDLVFRCSFDYGRYWNLCGNSSKTAVNEAIACYEKCLDCFDSLPYEKKTPELDGLKYESEYRLGLLYLEEAEGSTGSRRAKPLLMAEKFLLSSMSNTDRLSQAINLGAAAAAPEMVSARIMYALAKAYHLHAEGNKDSREMYLEKCIAAASAAIDSYFTQAAFPLEWEHLVKMRTEASVELCGYKSGNEYADSCINFQNEYMDHLRATGQLAEAFRGYVRLGDFHLKTARPKTANNLLTAGNKYEQGIRDFFGSATAGIQAAEDIQLKQHAGAAYDAYVSALELGRAALMSKSAILNTHKKKTKALIAMYTAQPEERYLTEAVESIQPCLDSSDIPVEQADIMLIIGRLFMLLGSIKTDPKDKHEFYIHAQRTYKQAVDAYIHDNDVEGRRYAEEILREISFMMLQDESQMRTYGNWD